MRATRIFSWAAALLSVCLAVGALALWRASLSSIDIRQVNDLGLGSVLPPTFFLAFIALTISFCLTLHWRQLTTPVLLLHLIILIFMLYGTTALVEETPRLHVAWRHVGFVEYIMRTGSLEHKVDAYFDWPGFFALSALVTKISGLENPLRFIAWASMFFNLLYLGPLLMILRAATTDQRVVWLGVWFFYLTHWPEYDFFAPQALNYFFYMVILGILLQWFRVVNKQPGIGPWLDRFRLPPSIIAKVANWFASEEPVINLPNQPLQRAGLLVIMTVLFVASVSSHMLSPFFMLAAVTALVVSFRITPRGLPIVMAVIIGTWLSYMAVSYLSGHLANVTEDVGNISKNLSVNVVRRLKGSPEHIFVVQVRLVMSLAVWALAGLGWIRRLRNRRFDLTFILLSLVPFPLLALQGYGGEMMLRIYMFALPPMLFFLAALFYPLLTRKPSWWTGVGIYLLSFVFLLGFLLARYGNERMDYFTSQEVSAVEYLYNQAEPGSQLVAVTGNVPWRYQDYEKYRHALLSDLGGKVIMNTDMDAITNRIYSNRDRKSYLIVTRSQEAWADLFFGWEPGTFDRLDSALKTSGKFDLIFENEDASVYVRLRENER